MRCTSDRPYRVRLAHAEAVGYLREQAGRTLDDDLVGLFVELFGGVGARRNGARMVLLTAPFDRARAATLPVPWGQGSRSR